ncbi:MAG TPA: hypothetical protein VF771_17260, partial [Longimicrobiaceae bacterium]
MTAWMLFAATVAALCGVAALAAERALRLHRLPARGAWAAAMALSIALPFLLPRPGQPVSWGGGMMEMRSARSPISTPAVEMR